MLRCVEPDLLPRFAGVGGFVNTIAVMRHHTAHRMFTHANVNHIRITFGDSYGADGTGFEVTVGDIAPGDPHVVRLPKTATGCSHVVGFGIANHAGSAN